MRGVVAASPGEAPSVPGVAGATAAGPARPMRLPLPLPLPLLLALTAGLLLVGTSKSVALDPDLIAYRCYGFAFVGGSRGAYGSNLPFCLTYLGGIPPHPAAILPQEYGPLALLVFVPPVLAPAALYPWLFAAEMLLVLLGVTVLLHRTGAPGAAHVWLLFVLLGSMVTALARFDLVPAACLLLALLALRRGRHTWAYLALAAGVLLKFYPLVLLPLFLVETWRTRRALPAWRGPLAFAGAVTAVEMLAALIAPEHILDPLRFLGGRCVEVESLPATLSSLWARLTGAPVALSYSTASNTMCQQSPGLAAFGFAVAILAVMAAIAVLVLRLHGRLGLVDAAVLLLCISMLGSKVFSPQYLLWVTPLVAWSHGLRPRPFLAWGLLCLITTVCFPFSYGSLPLSVLHLSSQQMVPLTAGLRNLLFAALVTSMLAAATMRALPAREPLALRTADVHARS